MLCELYPNKAVIRENKLRLCRNFHKSTISKLGLGTMSSVPQCLLPMVQYYAILHRSKISDPPGSLGDIF